MMDVKINYSSQIVTILNVSNCLLKIPPTQQSRQRLVIDIIWDKGMVSVIISDTT